MSSSNDLKESMIRESLLILKSVNWTEHAINKKTLDLQRARINHNEALEEQLEKEIRVLLRKIDRENENMSRFMAKYKAFIEDEKKTILFDFRAKD